MTKEIFIQFYDLFATFIRQEVNGDYVMNASCLFVDYCGGYCLELHPDCLMWGSDLSFMHALAERFCLSMCVRFNDGVINIY